MAFAKAFCYSIVMKQKWCCRRGSGMYCFEKTADREVDGMEWAEYLNNLEVPKGPIDVVIDTDAFNEVDDQFAIAYLLASGEKLRLRALYAAPYSKQREPSPEKGMEKSFDEILRLLALEHREEFIPLTFRGSRHYLPDEAHPVYSEAAEHLISLALTHDAKNPLYVISIGAVTNVASALLLRPEIADRIVIVWLGGHGREYHNTREFNLYQDIAAARVMFRSGAPIVQLPCNGVVSGFSVSFVEMEHYLSNQNPVCDFLLDRVREALKESKHCPAASRVLWDVATVAWLLNDNDRFMLSRLTCAPVPEYDDLYAYDTSRLIRYVYFVNRDALASDLFAKLTDGKCFQKGEQPE